MSSITTVPLNRLIPGRANARRTDRKTGVEELAASILAHGLLQNLVVVAIGEDRFEVDAGGRRLAALKLLAARGDLPKDWGVPCHVVSAGEAPEASLAENVHRVAMNVMDEVEAFAALVDGGAALDDVARRFGVTLRHVEQRLALARLSPKVRAAYRRSDITLDVARAFCLAADHATQERVLRQFAKPLSNAHAVRAALTQGRIPAADRLARFVGVAAYETAGGRLVRDLFETDVVLLEDGDLLRTLAQQTLDAAAATYTAAGWGWVATSLTHTGVEGCASERLQPAMSKLSRTKAKALDAARADLAAIDEKLENADDDGALWQAREDAEARVAALLDEARHWDSREIALAGVSVAVDYDGTLAVTPGLIRRADLKALAQLRKSSASTGGDTPAVADTRTPPGGEALSQALVRDLTAARTRALRAAIIGQPGVALALVVHALSQTAPARRRVPGVGIAVAPVSLDDDDRLVAARAALDARTPDDIGAQWNACMNASAESLLADLAVRVADTLDLSHSGAHGADHDVQAFGDRLAAALGLDMTLHWTPDEAFFVRAPKSVALAALETAPDIVALSPSARAQTLASSAKLKKADLAALAARSLKQSRWLPDVLVTPTPAGAFAVTDAGSAALDDTAAA